MLLNDMFTSTNIMRWTRKNGKIEKSRVNPDIAPRKRFAFVSADKKGSTNEPAA